MILKQSPKKEKLYSLYLFFKISFLSDLHPCVDIKCPYYATCKAKSASEHECICDFSCPSFEDYLCSAQGVTYSNQCEYKKAICLSKKHVGISHPGSCKRELKKCLFNPYLLRRGSVFTAVKGTTRAQFPPPFSSEKYRQMHVESFTTAKRNAVSKYVFIM